MPNTYTQINIHAVFTVKGRENLLTQKFRPKLFEYISGILKNIDQFPLAVNGYQDHVHIFFELKPTRTITEIMRIVKSNSSKWINENGFINGKFSWQEGYGAFSYSRSQRNDVINYIINQEQHHSKVPFKIEYIELLNKFDVEYDNKYLFEFLE